MAAVRIGLLSVGYPGAKTQIACRRGELQACLVSEAPLTAARDNEGMMMAPVQRILAAASVGEETAGPVEGRSQRARLSMSMRQGWFVTRSRSSF